MHFFGVPLDFLADAEGDVAEVVGIDVTEGDDVLTGFGNRAHIAAAASAGTDDGKVEFGVGGLRRDDGRKAQGRRGGGADGGLKKAAAGRARKGVHGGAQPTSLVV